MNTPWDVIEHALKRFENFSFNEAQVALEAVGEAKRRESELEGERDVLKHAADTADAITAARLTKMDELKRHWIHPLKLQAVENSLIAERTRAEASMARVAELERALERIARFTFDVMRTDGLDAADLKQIAREALGAWQEAQPPVYGFSDTTNEARGEATGE